MSIQKSVLFPFILFLSISATAQSNKSYYVTIGVFANVSNANRLVEKATKQGYAPLSSIGPFKVKLNYVYILKTEDKRKAYALAVKLRVETEYKDAWVYDGKFDGETVAATQVRQELPKEEPPVEKPVIEIKPAETPTPVVDSATLAKPATIVEPPVETPVKKTTGKPFYIKLINEKDGTEIKSGVIHLQETAKDAHYQAFNSGEIVYLDAPKNKRGTYTIVTEVAGYTNTSVVFNYENPSAEKGPENELIIELPLSQAKKGDYVDFNNVKFFKNASILQAPAQNELDGLVDLLKENAKYKIRIHGHVNGTRDRDCIVRSENSSFFALTKGVDKSLRKMSAKDLSTARAETVRDYLVSQGIETDRIKVKGDGGKIPIYPEEGTMAPMNDRIEIEFTKH